MTTPSDRALPLQFQIWIAEQVGLHFGADKLDWLEELATRQAAATHCRSASEYLLRLMTGGEFARAERPRLIEQLTVGETYFFRNNDQFRAWAELYMQPRIPTCSEVNPIRVLSAGCASGEEPYTMAILINQAAAYLPASHLSIQAVDLNPRSLERAEAGTYSLWALRQTSAAIRSEYFQGGPQTFQLRDDIRSRVRFREANLADPTAAFWREPAYDAIFCRNVLMYFTPDAMRGVVDRLTALLKPGGVLFLGHAETLRGLSQEYHLCNSHETFYYRRKAPGETSETTRWPAAKPVSDPPPGFVEAPNTLWPATIEAASERIRVLHSGSSGSSSRRPVSAGSAAKPVGAAHRQQTMAMALEFMRLERYSEAAAVLTAELPDAERDTDAQLLLAVLLINAGDVARGQAACARLLAQDELNAGAHYLMALCHEQAGELAEAVRHNQTALYLDPTFSIPQLHLGLLARKAGDGDGAERALRHAQLLLAREDASRILLFGGGFSREMLINLCAAELRRRGGVA